MKNKIDIIPLLYHCYLYIDIINDKRSSLRGYPLEDNYFVIRAKDILQRCQEVGIDANEFSEISTSKDPAYVKLLGTKLAYHIIKSHIYI